MPTCSIVFDFDGTLAPGAGPALAFARVISENANQPLLYQAAGQAVLAQQNGEPLPGDGFIAVDGYQAVSHVAAQWQVDPTSIDEAYTTSRQFLATEAAPIDAPPGLRAALERVHGAALLVLATNSPDVRIAEALEFLGIEDLIDRRFHSLGKPAGLRSLVRDQLTQGPVLAVGDIWVNDLAPARELGADTALVGPAARGGLPATFSAPALPGLYDPIHAWVQAHSAPLGD